MMRWLLLAVALLVGCTSIPKTTELLVVVDSDLAAGRDLSALHVQVFDETGQQRLLTQDFSLSDASALPLSFSLYPLSSARALWLSVTARDTNGDDVVERQLIASFHPGQRWLLSVFLEAVCKGELCRDAMGARTAASCVAGACSSTSEATLSPAGAGPLGGYELDAGAEAVEDASADAAPSVRDARPDDARALACSGNDDCTPKLGTVEPAGCALARCVDGTCVFEVADKDGDGDRQRRCRASGVALVPGMDCDDSDRAVSSLAWDGPAGMDGDALREDRCDQVDNDCNGAIDDGRIGEASCVCDPSTDQAVACSELEDGSQIVWPAGAPAGACKAGTKRCVAGAYTPCTGAVLPAVSDSCSSADDDSNCNGVASEDCQCTDGATRPCGIATGSCVAGTQTCVAGRWSSVCAGAVMPAAADTCDAMNDANCNGVVNEGCKCVNGTTSTCGQVLPSLGDCLERAVVCAAGQWPSATCTAQCDDCPLAYPCAPGTCVDGQHTFSCDCPAGYQGDGTQSCTVVNDCPASAPCSPGTCVDGVNAFSCDCPSGYDGTGTQACTPHVTVCPGAAVGLDGGMGVRCGANAHCLVSADGGVGCACDTGYVELAGSSPPSCAPP